MLPSRYSHAFKLGFRSLAAHRLRSGLTALGIVLGVASVVVMLAVGEAARYQALKQLEDLGANTIVLRSIKPTDEPVEKSGVDQSAYGLTYLDLLRIQQTVPTILAATPMREYRKTIRYQNHKLETRVVSVTPEFMAQNNITVHMGRGINDHDEQRFANVAVLGSTTAEVLFPTQNPIGRSITMENMGDTRSYVVIGVTEPKTLAAGSERGDVDYNRVMFIPFSTDRVRIGKTLVNFKATGFEFEQLEISQITVTVDNTQNVAKTAAVIQSLIEQFHPRKDVMVTVPLDLLMKAEQTQRLFTLILGAIAGISLIVGGIGIMNIMLATVTERTREIGIRRALGAKQRDIATQFLVETIALTCGGGILGVVVGIALAYLVSDIFGLPAIIRIWSPILAFGVSVFVGLISGLYPARRAARLDPIEALRHE